MTRREESNSGRLIVWPPGLKVVTKKDGRVYVYERASMAQLWAGTVSEIAADPHAVLACIRGQRDGRPIAGTVARLLHDYELSGRFARLSPQTQALYAPVLVEARRRLGALALAELGARKGRDAIRCWRRELEARSPRSADNVLIVLGAVSKWGRMEDVLPPDCRPTADMERVYAAPPQAAWAEEEIAHAVRWLPAHLAAAVALAVETGLRREDLVTLTQEACDPEAGVIRWRTGKGRRYRREAIIDLTPGVRAALQLATAPRTAHTCLVNSDGQPWTADGLWNSLRPKLAHLGITGRTLHGLRRSLVSRLSAQGLSEGQIARRVGWSEREVARMLATYIDPEAENQARRAVIDIAAIITARADFGNQDGNRPILETLKPA